MRSARSEPARMIASPSSATMRVSRAVACSRYVAWSGRSRVCPSLAGVVRAWLRRRRCGGESDRGLYQALTLAGHEDARIGLVASDGERVLRRDVADGAVAQRRDARGVVAERGTDALAERHEELALDTHVEQRTEREGADTERHGPVATGVGRLERDELRIRGRDQRVIRRVPGESAA